MLEHGQHGRTERTNGAGSAIALTSPSAIKAVNNGNSAKKGLMHIGGIYHCNYYILDV